MSPRSAVGRIGSSGSVRTYSTPDAYDVLAEAVASNDPFGPTAAEVLRELADNGLAVVRVGDVPPWMNRVMLAPCVCGHVKDRHYHVGFLGYCKHGDK